MELKTLASLLIIIGASVALTARAEQNPMGFFVTSAGSGNGGNLGGLEGADAVLKPWQKPAETGASTALQRTDPVTTQ